MFGLFSFKNKLKKGFAEQLPEGAKIENISLYLKNQSLHAQYVININGESIKSDYEEIKGTTAKQLIDLAEQIGESQNLDSIHGYQLEANYLDNSKKASLFIFGFLNNKKIKREIKV